MKPSTLQLYKERILGVLVFIQKNLDEEVPLEEYARVAHFSPYHFHRVFRGMVGESLQEHIRRLRLERAATRLKHGDRSVMEIALEAGYETHEAFTRAFKALCGVSPTHFRRQRALHASPLPTPTAGGVHYQNGQSLTEFELSTGDDPMDVRIEHVEPLYVAFARHVGPYAGVGEAWEKVCMELGREGRLGGARFIGVCYDDPEVTAPEKIRYDACVTVDRDFQPRNEVGVETLAGGDYAITTHLGPYENLNQTYARLFGQWLPASGRELRSEPSLEVYLNAPESTDPEDLVTDIYAPLEPIL
jgi:AraC family transcriptional regulator